MPPKKRTLIKEGALDDIFTLFQSVPELRASFATLDCYFPKNQGIMPAPEIKKGDRGHYLPRCMGKDCLVILGFFLIYKLLYIRKGW